MQARISNFSDMHNTDLLSLGFHVTVRKTDIEMLGALIVIELNSTEFKERK